MTKHGAFALLALLVGTWLAPTAASAQSPALAAQMGGLQLSRSDLETLLERNRQVVGSSAYSGSMRERARKDIEMILQRLDEGDFRIGDRIVLLIEGEWPTADTFVVESGPQITLPILGVIPLKGVLRAELEEHLTTELARFIQQPIVHAESTIRLMMTGQVGSPGFYNVPSTLLVGEALMRAGIQQTSNLDGVRITRREVDREVDIWEGDALQDALAQGMTLDQMNLRAGDQFVVPAKVSSAVWGRVARGAIVLGSFLIFGVRIFF
ncbi:MAG: hypothetical protein R3E98_04520 [Gemmatimonadota bacterium]|nr:hypothetical protein [Gemmatimonadota bacterium]